ALTYTAFFPKAGYRRGSTRSLTPHASSGSLRIGKATSEVPMTTALASETLEEIWRQLDGGGRSSRIFYPCRKRTAPPARAFDYDIPVAPDVTVGARWHRFDALEPSVLAFHGNGETVSDYDDIAVGWHGVGFNFFMVDYRGYGWSGGTPTLRALCED